MSTTTDELHELSWTELSSLRPPDSKPELTDTYGTALAPRPAWAIYAGMGRREDAITFVGPSAEVLQHPEFMERAIVEVRAELTTSLTPTWVQWYLQPATIHIEAEPGGFTLEQARKLAAEILRLADEVEGVER